MKFSYVIASRWEDDKGWEGDNLSVYEYGGGIQFGTNEDAEHLLKYVKRNSDGADYKILKVTFTEV